MAARLETEGVEAPVTRRQAIGAPIRRTEDPSLLVGEDRFVADIVAARGLVAHFVRSDSGHGIIRRLDAVDAVSMPGVVGVFTAADVPLEVIAHTDLKPLLPAVVHRPALATDRVRYVGDIIAVVVAETAAQAIDAASTVSVDVEPLDVVIDPESACSEAAALLFPTLASNVVFEAEEVYGDDVVPRPDDHVVSLRVTMPRMAVAPMEGNVVLAVPDADGPRITMWASNQHPHLLRDMTAGYVGMNPADLRVICPAVGGGFGGKVPCEAEYAIVVGLARRLRRPVKWVQSRNENLMAMQARGHVFDVQLRATSDGVLRSLRVDAISDLGAYPGVGIAIMMNTRGLINGPYRFRRIEYRGRGVATNTSPITAFRGAGRPEATTLLERAMDVLAVRTGIDPAELRRRNLIGRDEFPYATPVGTIYDSGDYHRSLDVALELAGYDALRREQARRRTSGDRLQLGVGISCYVELSAKNTFAREYGSVEVRADGTVRAGVGTFAHGQGHRTAFQQVLSDVLGIPMDRIEIVQGDTDEVPTGMGTAGSRSMQVGGSALKVAADAVIEQGRAAAAVKLEAALEDIDFRADVGFGVRGVPISTMTWRDVADAMHEAGEASGGPAPRLFADPGFAQSVSGTAPFGCHVAVVEVDVETGAVRLDRIVAVDDCGNIINPLLAEGQIHGGLASGIGQALFEQIHYDSEGNQVTSSFAEYLLPSAADLPSYECATTVTPTPHNPLGAKGVGEGGTTGSIAAVQNAVVDAVAHLGVEHIDLCLSPMNVWQAIQSAR